jgi:DNA-binding transcriptional LysR family regulator
VVDRELGRSGLELVPLGEELNVLVESTVAPVRPRVFLDHDPDDTTTERYLRLNGRRFDPQWRSFLDDIYGILDAAAAGWGQAVVSRHMLRDFPGLRMLRGRPLRTPVVLHWRRQPYYTRLHHEVVAALAARCPPILAEPPPRPALTSGRPRAGSRRDR